MLSQAIASNSAIFPCHRASVGYAVTWIMSQRILIHLRGEHSPFRASYGRSSLVGIDAAAEHHVKNVVVSHKLNSGRDVSRAMRGQFNGSTHKDRLDDEYDLKGRSITANGDNQSEHVLTDVELDIQVQVEQTVTVDYLHDHEPYDGPKRVQASTLR